MGLKIRGFLKGLENDPFFQKNREIPLRMLPVRHQ
jgi:hypothetical protein